MVVSNSFYNSAGILRWNLGWASPTYSGAFLATIVPFAWALGKSAGVRSKKWRHLPLVAEGILVFLLCKTQSRGALVALVAAGAYWHFLSGKYGGWRRFAARAALLVGCVWIAGFSPRIEPGYVTSDLSIRNRLTLWEGSLKVLGVTPLGGCGAGSSGRLVRAWFQPLDQTVAYPTPINSYLFSAIEFGFVVSGLSIFVLILSVAAAPKGGDATDSSWHDLAMASGSSIVAWSVASFFSTLWDELPLWIVPALAMAISIGRAAYRRRIVAPAIAALGLTVAIEGSARAVAWGIVRTERIIPKILARGTTELDVAHAGRNQWPTCHIWLDRTVFGADPEKELRRWLAVEGSPSRVVVHDRWSGSKFDPDDGDVVVLVGRSAERLAGPLNRKYSRIILIAPIDPYRASLPLPPNAVVVLPAIDQDGTLAGLRDSDSGRFKIVASGVGEDIRSAWPDAMEQVDEMYRQPANP